MMYSVKISNHFILHSFSMEWIFQIAAKKILKFSRLWCGSLLIFEEKLFLSFLAKK